jgi:outer membrane protein assembly factor BamB
VTQAAVTLPAGAEKELLKLDKQAYVPALVNLGNLTFLDPDMKATPGYYGRACAKEATNAAALLGLARANHELENYGSSQEAYAKLKKVDASLTDASAALVHGVPNLLPSAPMSRRAPLVALFLVFAAVVPAVAQSVDWPRWRGPDANGIAPSMTVNPKALAGQAKIAWKAALGTGFSSVAVADRRVYGMGNAGGSDTVYCLDAGSGRVLWKYSYACSQGSYPGPRATPTVHEGIVYTLSLEGHLHALDAANGKVRWLKHLRNDLGIQPPGWDFAGSVVVAGDRLVLNAGRSGLALDPRTGATLWESGQGPGGYATPVLASFAGRPSAVIFGERAVYGVDLADGTVRWSFDWQTGSDVNAADPVVLGDRVFVATAYGKGSALYDVSGARPVAAWRNNTFQTHFSSFVAAGGFLYGIDGDAREPGAGALKCVEAATGKTAWSAPSGFGSLVATREHLVVLNSTGTIVVAELSSAGYRELARCSLPRNQYWTPPALAEGKLFVRNLTGDLFAIDVR